MMRVLGCLLLAAAQVACADSTTEPDPEPAASGAFTPGPDQLAFASDRDGAHYIYVANLDGTGLARLVPGDEPKWSWDGRRIAFSRTREGGGSPSVWVLNADGSERRLAYGRDPDWSPDDRKIVFADHDGIHVVASDGSGTPQRLLRTDAPLPRHPLYRPELHDNASFDSPSWSPDGRRIVFGRVDYSYGIPQPVGTRAIYVMDADGSSLRLLGASCQVERPGAGTYLCAHLSPTWSADGSRIAVTLHDHSPGNYWRASTPRSPRCSASSCAGIRMRGIRTGPPTGATFCSLGTP